MGHKVAYPGLRKFTLTEYHWSAILSRRSALESLRRVQVKYTGVQNLQESVADSRVKILPICEQSLVIEVVHRIELQAKSVSGTTYLKCGDEDAGLVSISCHICESGCGGVIQGLVLVCRCREQE